MRNICLSYGLSFLHNSWFWLGIWVLYYLRFTNYAGIGILEAIMIITSISAEIPTGAIADLLGKKHTLTIAFTLTAFGNLTMVYAINFTTLIIAVIFITVGGAFYSGTLDALVYDSLKEKDIVSKFHHTIARTRTIRLIALTVCGAVGGFLYAINPRLPFILTGAASLAGIILTQFLSEPIIDTEKFSLSNYVKQTQQGFKQLFVNSQITTQTILFIIIGIFIVINFEMLNDVLLVEFGFKETQLGIVAAVIFLTSAVASHFSETISKIIPVNMFLLLMGTLIAITMLVSPLIGLIIGGLTVILRNSFQIMFENSTSTLINNHTESKFRATTISTFEMIKKIPYVFIAFYIGTIMSSFGAKQFAGTLGLVMLFILLIYYFVSNRWLSKENSS